MAKHRITANAEIDLLNQSELTQALDRQTRDWFQEEARGFSTARFGSISTISGGNVTVPAQGGDKIGPDAGFAWAVQRISAKNLATNDKILVYRNSVSDLNFIDELTATSLRLSFGGKGLVLRAEETLILTGTGLTATGDVIVNGEAIEVPELDIFKIL